MSLIIQHLHKLQDEGAQPDILTGVLGGIWLFSCRIIEMDDENVIIRYVEVDEEDSSRMDETEMLVAIASIGAISHPTSSVSTQAVTGDDAEPLGA